MSRPRIATTDVRTAWPAQKIAAPFYLTPEWRNFSDELIITRFGSRANAHCEDPNCKLPHRRGIRLFGDHVKEIQDGGELLDPENVKFRCGSCHTKKTNIERARRTDDTVRVV